MDGVPSRLAVLGMLGAGMRFHCLFPCMALDCAEYGSMIHRAQVQGLVAVWVVSL
jgi:hypothetical protein